MPVAWKGVMAIELSEAPAELDVLLPRDILAAKQQDTVLQERLIDLAEERLAHRRRDIDIANFRTQRI